MTKEEIISEIKIQRSNIASASRKINELVMQLENIPTEDWDWITVKQGADLLGVSVTAVYKKINNKELKVRLFGTKKLIKKSDIEKING